MRLKGNDKYFQAMNTKDMNECTQNRVVNGQTPSRLKD